MFDQKYLQKQQRVNELVYCGNNHITSDQVISVSPIDLLDLDSNSIEVNSEFMERYLLDIGMDQFPETDNILDEVLKDDQCCNVSESISCSSNFEMSTGNAAFPSDWFESRQDYLPYETLQVSSANNETVMVSSALNEMSSCNGYNDDLSFPTDIAETTVVSECDNDWTVLGGSNVTQSQVILNIPESVTSVHSVIKEEELHFADLVPHCSKTTQIKQESEDVLEDLDKLMPMEGGSRIRRQSEGRPTRPTRKRLSSSVTSYTDDDDESDAGSNSNYSSDEEGSERLLEFAGEFYQHGCKHTPFFWQYNAQNRGPKGRRLQSTIELKDPYVLDDYVDPVTDESTKQHGSDPKPCPDQLLKLGARIKTLEEEFRSLSVASTSASKTDVNRKKNMLASRICRLKRKALHEANKIKLYGLREEHRQLQMVIANLVSVMIPTSSRLRLKPTITDTSSKPINDNQPPQAVVPPSAPLSSMLYEEGLKTVVLARPSGSARPSVSRPNSSRPSPWGRITSLVTFLSSQIKQHLKYMIAGHTGDYVNLELRKFASRLINQHSGASI